MINTTLNLKEALKYISNNTTNNIFKSLFLTEKEFTELSDLKNIFEIFVKPSVKLQGQVYITLNRGLIYIY
jgi:hypothetical protein